MGETRLFNDATVALRLFTTVTWNVNPAKRMRPIKRWSRFEDMIEGLKYSSTATAQVRMKPIMTDHVIDVVVVCMC